MPRRPLITAFHLVPSSMSRKRFRGYKSGRACGEIRQSHLEGNRLGQEEKDLGQRPNGLGQRPNDLGQRENGLGQRENGLGQRPNGLGQRPNGLGQRPNNRPSVFMLTAHSVRFCRVSGTFHF